MEGKGTKILHRGKYLGLYQDGHYEFVQRQGCEGAVVLIPLTEEGNLILLEQYRVPLKKRVIEWPAGLVGDEAEHRGEDWERAARRELLEETGYEAAELELLTRGPTTPGMSNEIVALYLARGLKRKGPGGGDHHEDIWVHEVPVEKVGDWLREQEAKGRPIDAKVYAGLYFLSRLSNGRFDNRNRRPLPEG